MPARKTATGEGAFIWSEDEVELLLDVTLDYGVQQTGKGVDWESVQTKYADIADRLRLVIDKSRETGESGKDYPHSSAEITKDKVMTKLKNIRKKYRNAADTGKKSGQGRVVLLYFNECEKIWGGSPATAKLQTGLETVEINDGLCDTPSLSADSQTSDAGPAKFPPF